MVTFASNVALVFDTARLDRAIEAATEYAAQTIFNASISELEYADNFRRAWLDDEAAVTKYAEIADNGCCGSATYIYKVGERYLLLGCNYGH